eukprot:gnl/TRDRNA2_/TRDRNA2_178021_c0_seq11.p2 gnl/TRDRNA2_/TRDRNA2_178021_c0~~gnl/TRDRNA2_/TRDRNA2_178021_c0_seq11.p2  ORF type:complete len:333 (+),score=-5.42 gnl/TRDRNA2_/TRDRNA2_178021_c0_seq11:3385-4383(+)
MTLKTFHFAGVANMNVTLGIPRIKEVVTTASNISTPIMKTTVSQKNCKKMVEKLIKTFENITVGQISKEIQEICTKIEVNFVLRIDTQILKALKLKLTIQDMENVFLDSKKIFTEKKDIEVLNHHKLRIIITKLLFDQNKASLKKILSIEETLSLCFIIKETKEVLSMFMASGISTIENVQVSENKDNTKWIVYIEGTGIRSVMNKNCTMCKKLVANHVFEIFGVLGIEAARFTIISEIEYVMISYAINNDNRHLILLADFMTCLGEVLGITRFGLTKMKDSVLMLASFENTATHLFQAALNGKTDKLLGVSECIITGTAIRMGSGLLRVLR